MSDQLPDELGEERPERADEGHPIIAGLVALVGVAVAVGLILGLVVLGGTRLLGLGDDSGSSSSSAQRSLYVPKPEKTPKATEPKITLAPDGETATQTPTKEPTRSTAPRKQITLSASATSVAPMERLDLTGVYPGGEGAILRVERFADGSWQDFGVTAAVGNEVFTTYVQTGVPGVNRFRMVDTDSGLESNEVRVTIG